MLKGQYNEKYDYNKRKTESQKIHDRYPYGIPVIVEFEESLYLSLHKNIRETLKSKYIFPIDMTLGQAFFTLRKRMSIPPEKSIFILINNKLFSSMMLLSKIYAEEQDSCGFLYMVMSGEKTFG